MKKYRVGIKVFQTVYIDVAAESLEEAEEKAMDGFLANFNLHADTFEVEEVKDEE